MERLCERKAPMKQSDAALVGDGLKKLSALNAVRADRGVIISRRKQYNHAPSERQAFSSSFT
jgi:propanediol utilization protein